MQFAVRKSQSATLLLTLLLVLALDFFEATPWETGYFRVQALFILGMALFAILYVTDRLVYKKQPDGIPLYYTLLIMLIPLYGALMAYAAFGQPLLYGLLSERSWYLLGAGILLYHLLVVGTISFVQLEKAMVIMIWGSLLFFLAVIAVDTLGVAEFADSKMIHVASIRGVRYKFQTFFITFGTIYYFVKYMKEKDYRYLIPVIILMSYILLVMQSRTTLLAITMTLVLFMAFNGSGKKILLLLGVTVAGFLMIQLIAPEFIETMRYLFEQMMMVMTGELSDDASANARIFAARIVLDYFEGNPLAMLFGTGSVSRHWEGGYSGLFGYFYPVDIGLLGGLFVYGVVGTVAIFLIPLFLVVMGIRRSRNSESVFVHALRYSLVYAIIKGVQGSFFFQPMSYVIPFFVLLAFLKLRQSEGRAPTVRSMERKGDRV